MPAETISDTAYHMQEFMLHAAPHMPVDIYWVPPLVFLLLFIASIVDAFTGRVPDVIIFLGSFIVTGAIGLVESWPAAAVNLGYGIAAGFIIWMLNEVWFVMRKEDAIGMGDAKWTLLAALCFGWQALVVAWGAGALIAICWMYGARAVGRKISHVHFAPFLLVGLVVGIWWFGFRN